MWMILWTEVLRTNAAVSHVEKNRFCFTGLIAFSKTNEGILLHASFPVSINQA